MASSKTRAINEAFSLFHLRGPVWQGLGGWKNPAMKHSSDDLMMVSEIRRFRRCVMMRLEDRLGCVLIYSGSSRACRLDLF